MPTKLFGFKWNCQGFQIGSRDSFWWLWTSIGLMQQCLSRWVWGARSQQNAFPCFRCGSWPDACTDRGLWWKSDFTIRTLSGWEHRVTTIDGSNYWSNTSRKIIFASKVRADWWAPSRLIINTSRDSLNALRTGKSHLSQKEDQSRLPLRRGQGRRQPKLNPQVITK